MPSQVQLDIRTGHAQTVEKVLTWLDEEGSVAGRTICDCGCGTGSLAIPLALRVRALLPIRLRPVAPLSLGDLSCRAAMAQPQPAAAAGVEAPL